MPRLFTCTVACQAVSFILVVVAVALVLTFWPKSPTIGMCNTTSDWSELVKTVASGGETVRAAYEILLSFHNPNRVSVALNRVGGSFSYKGQQVATLFLPASTIPAGSIADVSIDASLTPGV